MIMLDTVNILLASLGACFSSSSQIVTRISTSLLATILTTGSLYRARAVSRFLILFKPCPCGVQVLLVFRLLLLIMLMAYNV